MEKNCKECLHNAVCQMWRDQECQDASSFQLSGCNHFKDHSRFVELPCKVGDTVWYIRDCGDWVDICQKPCEICSTDCSSYRTEYRADWQAVEFEIENIKEALDVLFNYKKDYFATREEAEVAIAERRKGE